MALRPVPRAGNVTKRVTSSDPGHGGRDAAVTRLTGWPAGPAAPYGVCSPFRLHTTERLNTALAGRYTIEGRVGEGGMATVYLARDVRHNRRMALKVLKPDLGAIVGFSISMT